MGDFYGGHQALYSLQTQLGQHAADMNELRSNGWKTQTLAFKNLQHEDQDKKDKDIRGDVESDVTKLESVYRVGKTLGGAGAEVVGTLRGGGTVTQALSEGTRSLQAAGEGTKLFGEGATSVKDLSGVEGIIAGQLAEKGGEVFAKTAAKGFGAVGAVMGVASDIDNFIDTGNIFNEKDAAGNVVKQNLGVDIGNVATVVGGALDVASAFTGGALAPVAAAVNLFAAVDSTIAGIKQDDEEKAIDQKDPPPPKPPTQRAPVAFQQYGMLANQSHNPLNHIN